MPTMTGEFPRAIPRPVWLGARARNAVARPAFIGAVGLAVFIAATAALVLAPQQAKRGDVAALPAEPRPDTQPLVAGLVHARAKLETVDSALAYARQHIASAPKPRVDTLGARLTARRDSLATAVNDLDGLLTRVETAPLAASYRALGESPQMASLPRVKGLLDSLSEIERDREAFGNAGGTDPVYVALSARSSEIGRAIEAAAQDRRDALRQQLSKLTVPAPEQAVAEAPIVDTAAWGAERDSAVSLVAQATTALSDARAKARDYDKAVVNATQVARVDAPPVALLAAALVFGIALGFGAALLREVRHPRVSDEHELERVTGTRVLATIRPRPKSPDRVRRRADKTAPPYFDPGADGYQLTYLHLARVGASRLMLTITGDDTRVAAVVALNVAAIAVDEARSAIIIDTDVRWSPVATALGIPRAPGVDDLIRRRGGFAGVATSAPIGRDRSVDVIPSGRSAGNGTAGADSGQLKELFRSEATRLARHYEAIVVVAPLEQARNGLAATLPIPDTVVCAVAGRTRLSDVQKTLDALRASGAHPAGIVLWNARPPALESAERAVANDGAPFAPPEPTLAAR